MAEAATKPETGEAPPVEFIPHLPAPQPLPPALPSGSEDAVLVGSDSALDPALPKLKIAMVEVGQGDGFVIELPGARLGPRPEQPQARRLPL